MPHASIELFLMGLVFGLGFHVAGAAIDLVVLLFSKRRPAP